MIYFFSQIFFRAICGFFLVLICVDWCVNLFRDEEDTNPRAVEPEPSDTTDRGGRGRPLGPLYIYDLPVNILCDQEVVTHFI